MVKKSLHNINPDEKHSPGGRDVIIESVTGRGLHASKYRGFTTRCKPFINLKSRQARLDFGREKETLYKARRALEWHS